MSGQAAVFFAFIVSSLGIFFLTNYTDQQLGRIIEIIPKLFFVGLVIGGITFALIAIFISVIKNNRPTR